MRVLTPHQITGKSVLLRMDIDVPLKRTNGKMVITDDSRLRSGLPTLFLCLQYAERVVVMGHLGRPEGEDPDLSVAPVVEWFDKLIYDYEYPQDRFQVLENLRFEKGEEDCDLEYAKKLASLGNFYVNEAFAAAHKSSSTTVLPTLLPHAAGFHFDHEVHTLKQVRENPKRPLVAIIGGVKVEDKYQAVVALSKIADAVLVGGLLARKIKEQNLEISPNVHLAELNESGFDISPKSIEDFSNIIAQAKEVVWVGPLGKFEDKESAHGTLKVAEAVIKSGAYTIIGGGDTVSALSFYIDKFDYVSAGGGAMLKLLCEGTLPTIQALG